MFEENNMISDFSIGTLFEERYLIEKVLGEGGQGIVVKALDTKNYDNPVVIKALKNNVTDKWSLDKFKEEQRALAQLQGATGIVKLIDNGKTKIGRDYTIMEFVDGELLTNLIDDLPDNLPRVAALFQQIISAVEYAHRREIYHRDLKPDNIIVANPNTRAELTKIIDFGIAQQTIGRLDNIEATSNIVGTPYYLSPNALDGKADAKFDDIYSLGMIAYTMTTGQFPIPKENFSFATLRIMQREIDLYPPSEKNKTLSKEVDRIILKALAEEPNERYDSAEAFGDELSRALFQPFGGETRPIEPEVKKRKFNVNFLYLIIPVLLFAVFLGLLGWWAIFGSDKKKEFVSNNSAQNTNRAINSATENTNLSRNSANANTAATPTPSPAPDSNSFEPNDLSIDIVKQTKGSESVRTDASETFKAGDGIRLNISSAKDGFLQIFLKDNGGKTQKVLSSKIEANKTLSFPSPQWIFFDDKPGTEIVYVVVSDPKAPEKTDVGSLENQSGGTEFTTGKGSAVKVVRLNHE